MGLLVIAFMLIPSFAWLSGYSYMRTANGKNGTIIYTDIDTETLIAAGKMKPDCTDFRATSSGDVEQQIWFDPVFCNTTQTRFYWDTPNEITTTYSIYYGNAIASDVSNYSIFEGNLFNETDHESGTVGVREDYWEGYPPAVFDYNDSIAYTGNKSLFVSGIGGDGRAWSGKPVMETIDYNVIYETAMQIGTLSSGNFGIVELSGGTVTQPTILQAQALANGSVQVYHGSGPTLTITNQTVNTGLTGWDTARAEVDFSTDTVDLFINNQYAGNFAMREYEGEVSELKGIIYFAEDLIHSGNFDTIRLYRDIGIVTLGSEQESSSLTFSYLPVSPHVEEEVIFTGEAGDTFNITNWWWDFDDGTAVIMETDNVTTHTYFNGSVFNVTLIATNASTTNFTVSNLVTVFEPTIQIWAEDVINSVFIENFTVTAVNSTNSFNFTASGLFAEWEYFDGPKGNTSISIIKQGFNHTIEFINITNSSDVNFTASGVPAVMTFRALDFDFTNATVPFKVRLSNSTLEKNVVSSWIDDILVTNDCGAGGQVNDTSSIGQAWQISFNKYPGLFPNKATISLCDQFGDNCQAVYDEIGASWGDSGETKYLFVSKVGTWKILNENATTFDTGSFAYFPARVNAYINITCPTGQEGTWDVNRVNNEHYFYFNDTSVPTGNVSIEITQDTDGLFGFMYNTYSQTIFAYNDLSGSQLINQTVYMSPTPVSESLLFLVKDADDFPLDGVIVSLFYFIDDEFSLIQSGRTDSTGQIEFNVRESREYFFTVSWNDLSESGTVFVSTSGTQISVTLREDISQSPDNPLLQGVVINVFPSASSTLVQDTYQYFNVSIADSLSAINYSFVSIASSDLGISVLNESTSSAGISTINLFAIPELNSSATIDLAYGFWRQIESEWYYFQYSESYLVLPDTGLSQISKIEYGPFGALIGFIFIVSGFTIHEIVGVLAAFISYTIGFIPLDVVIISAIMAFIVMRRGID